MDLKEEELLGDTVNEHWYYRSKAAALHKYVAHLKPQSILDVGAGSGFFSKNLLRHTNATQAICVDHGYAGASEDLIDGKTVEYKISCGVTAADLVLLMDVLEHVDDDVGLLKEYVGKVPGGSHFLITVPAFSFLWSGHDEFLEHKRRYTISQLEKVVVDAGLSLETSSYYYGFLFPLVATLRMSEQLRRNKTVPRSQLQKHGGLINGIFSGVCALERPILKFNRIAGLSVFCLARKT